MFSAAEGGAARQGFEAKGATEGRCELAGVGALAAYAGQVPPSRARGGRAGRRSSGGSGGSGGGGGISSSNTGQECCRVRSLCGRDGAVS